jgi:hypothetical protein
MRFNPPPGWPSPPAGWTPPQDWKPDPAWPAPPPGWQLWIPDSPDAPQPPLTDADPGPIPERATSTAAPRTGEQDGPRPVAPDRATHLAAPEVAALKARIADLEATLEAMHATSGPPVELSDQRVLQDVGIYRYHHPLEDSPAYKDRLNDIEGRIDEMVKGGRAILAADMFTFAGSLAKGRRMVADLSKLMLRAYNAEADNCVRSMRSGNVITAKRRLDSAVTAIEMLGAMMDMRVTPTTTLCGWPNSSSPLTIR